jgi:hypothetical protein
MAEPMTPNERAWVIDEILDCTYADRWTRQQIEAASTDEEAIAWCRTHLHGWGYTWRAPDGRLVRIMCGSFAKHGDAEATIGDHHGRFTWREIVRAARARARQLALF